MDRQAIGTDTSTLSQADSAGHEARDARRVEPPLLGEIVGRYQLRRVLGEGGMGRVYLARDMTLGRSVALKVVRRDVAGAAWTARFLDEARVIASLNHPNIVQLYDVGEHRGVPYLALEYVEGESLKERCRRERVSLDEALRILRAIASALIHAHAAHVYHCDLKPSNVMLARDGRLRVVDFGLAHTDTSAVATMSGTPDWMAPEQWSGLPASDRVDVWALAVMSCQLIGGQHPLGDNSDRRSQITGSNLRVALDARIPSRVGELVEASLDRDPSRRPPATEWYRVFDELVERRGAASLDDSPYRGLVPFAERDAGYFWGREPEIDAFTERLRLNTVLPIVGPSGAGKSSFLFAGVIPRLRARGPWTIVSLRPGSDPFEALANQLTDGADAQRQLARDLRETPTLAAARLQTLAAATHGSVLLVVDQLEELFTLVDRDEDIERFLRLLMNAADEPLEPVRIVFTIRDDFVGRVAGLRTLFVLKRLSRDELRMTITRPLERVGYQFDDERIVDDMLSELGDDVAAQLPLLQFACRALWEVRDPTKRMLLSSSYREIGGVGGALARHADGLMTQLLPIEQRLARQILVSLVVGTSRTQIDRVRLAVSPEASRVVDRLVAARLLAQHTAPGTDTTYIELAHESLLRTWARLARWLDESRDERRLLHQLDEAAQFWERRGARIDEAWDADELAAARHQIAALSVDVPARVQAFLDAGERRHRIARRRARTRLAIGAALAAVVTIVSLIVANEFRRQRDAAEEQAVEHQRALDNVGHFDLVLQPFDWIENAPRAVAPARLPALSWRLYEPLRTDEHRPGQPIPDEKFRVVRKASRQERIDNIEVRGGTAFLRIDGRGADGARCAPSWIRLQKLPGYADRGGPLQTLEIAVPTCQASAANTVSIPAGEFIYGGPGDPPTRDASYVEHEQTVWVGEFRIDRTEVSNAQFKAFANLARDTGYAGPTYQEDGLYVDANKPDRPVAAIDAFVAEAYCRYMGKRLPSDFEWTKAARGGLVIDGKPNPAPRRLFPWGTERNTRCANIEGDSDGFTWVAPVDAQTCDKSPYGVLALGGNVAEWISRAGQVDRASSSVRVVRGGAADSPPELEHMTTVFRNSREARKFLLTMGVRCVEPVRDDNDSWDRP